jgi:hypothetical protein
MKTRIASGGDHRPRPLAAVGAFVLVTYVARVLMPALLKGVER